MRWRGVGRDSCSRHVFRSRGGPVLFWIPNYLLFILTTVSLQHVASVCHNTISFASCCISTSHYPLFYSLFHHYATLPSLSQHVPPPCHNTLSFTASCISVSHYNLLCSLFHHHVTFHPLCSLYHQYVTLPSLLQPLASVCSPYTTARRGSVFSAWQSRINTPSLPPWRTDTTGCSGLRTQQWEWINSFYPSS